MIINQKITSSVGFGVMLASAGFVVILTSLLTIPGRALASEATTTIEPTSTPCANPSIPVAPSVTIEQPVGFAKGNTITVYYHLQKFSFCDPYSEADVKIAVTSPDGSPVEVPSERHSVGDFAHPLTYSLDWPATVAGTYWVKVTATPADLEAGYTPGEGFDQATVQVFNPTYTISGNTGVGTVTLTYTDGTDKIVTTDAGGYYSFTVPYNWSGTVTPSRDGYSFTPESRTYPPIFTDQTGQNYTAQVLIYYIISGNAGVGGVNSWLHGWHGKDRHCR